MTAGGRGGGSQHDVDDGFLCNLNNINMDPKQENNQQKQHEVHETSKTHTDPLVGVWLKRYRSEDGGRGGLHSPTLEGGGGVK